MRLNNIKQKAMKFSAVAIAVAMACFLAASALPMTANVTEAKKKGKKAAAQVDLDAGKYNARMGIQTADTLWISNLGYYGPSNNALYGTEDEHSLVAADPSGNNTVYDGTFTDTVIEGNGTYTVSLEGADFAGETTISQLQIATDMPVNDTVKFTNVNVTINGMSTVTFDEAYIEDEEKYNADGEAVIMFNHWRKDLVTMLKDLGLSETAESGYTLLKGTGDESIQITFTVEGFNYDNPNATGAEEVSSESSEASDDGTTGESASTTTSSDSQNSQSKVPIIIIAVIAVVVVVVVVVVVAKKKKD